MGRPVEVELVVTPESGITREPRGGWSTGADSPWKDCGRVRGRPSPRYLLELRKVLAEGDAAVWSTTTERGQVSRRMDAAEASSQEQDHDQQVF